jgi:hypothetical protein
MTHAADSGGMRRYLFAILASLILAGCGGVDSSVIATAVRTTEDAGGAEVAFQVEMELPVAGEPVVMTGSGVEDASSGRGQLTFDMSALARLPGAGALCTDSCEMEIVSDGSSVYMRSALFAGGLGGKEWMKLDLERFGNGVGIPMGSSGMPAQSASQQLQMLRGVSDDVTDEGREPVRGVETTHYSATVDLRRSVEALPEAQRDAARRGIDKVIAMTGQSELPFDVWIDDEDRVRRLEMEMTMGQAGMELKALMTIEYVRFGVPVEIDVPDDDDVFDATDLALQQMNN